VVSLAFGGFSASKTGTFDYPCSAPLEAQDFRGVVLGQLGEPRLLPAIETDVSGEQSHAKALDADTKGPLRTFTAE